ncbi:hypothetical protein LINPERHAP1_LOCUS31324 [Linum perenne]
MAEGSDSQENLPDPVEMIVYYDGTMTNTERGPEYKGGAAVEASIYRDFLCYFQLIKIATEELHYHAVERMWYVEPGLTPVDGLHPIRNDSDAMEMGKAAAGGVVSLYMEVGENESGFGDNGEDFERSDGGSDPEADGSGIRADEGIIHLLDDSDRTSDPEFAEAMANLGLTGYRRRVRTQYHTDGVEVDQMNEVTVNKSAQQEEIIIQDEGLKGMEFMNGRSPDGQSDVDDERSDKQRPREEPAGQATTIRRVKCGKCKAFGHNARTCTFVPGVQGYGRDDPPCANREEVGTSQPTPPPATQPTQPE